MCKILAGNELAGYCPRNVTGAHSPDSKHMKLFVKQHAPNAHRRISRENFTETMIKVWLSSPLLCISALILYDISSSSTCFHQGRLRPSYRACSDLRGLIPYASMSSRTSLTSLLVHIQLAPELDNLSCIIRVTCVAFYHV